MYCSHLPSHRHVMCPQPDAHWPHPAPGAGVTLFLSLTAPFYLILFVMFWAILYFLWSRGFSKRIPPIIGNYKRNVLSLKETFVYAFLFYSDMHLNSFLLKNHKIFGISVDSIRMYGFTHSLLINNTLEGIIWPLYILCNLNEHTPNKKAETNFYISGHQNLEPRRRINILDLTDVRFSQSKSKFKFVNQSVNKNLFSKMPMIDTWYLIFFSRFFCCEIRGYF